MLPERPSPVTRLILTKSEGGIGSEGSVSVNVDSAFNIIMVGNYTSDTIIFGNFTITNAGAEDIYIVKYDSSGTVLWAKSENGIGDDYVQQVSVDFNGNIFIGGFFNSSSLLIDSLTLNSSGGFDVFIVKYNSTGNVFWAKSGGGSTTDYGFSVCADNVGNVYFTGGFTGSSMTFDSDTITAPAFSNEPMFIVKFDSRGTILCAEALSCAGDDFIGVGVDNFNNAYVSGDYSANPFFIIGLDTLTSYGLAFVAKYYCPIFTGGNELLLKEDISVYPNPFTNQITFLFSNNEPTTISIYDYLTQNILQETFTNSITIYTEKLARGIYIYELRNKNGVIKKGKILKE